MYGHQCVYSKDNGEGEKEVKELKKIAYLSYGPLAQDLKEIHDHKVNAISFK